MTLAADLCAGLDPVTFAVRSLAIEPDPWQAHALRWSGSRVLLNCCRQAGKSTVASILALHRAIYTGNSLVLLVSPSLRQSSELFRKVTHHIERLPTRPRLVEDNRLSLRLENGSRVLSLPSSEATIRGFSGADLIIEDEASRVPDDLYRAVRPMLAVSGGRLVLMSTPFGKRGHFFDEWQNGGDTWERVRVAATDCPRIASEFLTEERRSLGEWWFRQENLCEFSDTVDQVFSHEAVERALSPDVAPLFGG